MAHARIGSRWHGARDLLAQLQPSPAHEMSIYTARGFGLDTMVLLAGHELVAATRPVSPAVAAAFATVLKLDVRDDDQPDTEIESLMNRAFARRADSLGLPTLRGPELRWAHASESARR